MFFTAIDRSLGDCGFGFRDERKLGGLPCGEAAGHLDEVGDAVLMENAGGGGRAITAGAMDGNAAVARDFSETLLKMIERDVDAAGYVLGGPFARIADIEDDGRAGEFGVEVGWAHAFGGGDEIGAVGQCGETVGEEAAHVIEADAAEAEGSFVLAAGLGDDDDGFLTVEQRAGPGGVLATEADVEAADEMALGELGAVADVEELRANLLEVENFIERERPKDLLEIAFERAALARIKDGVVGEVLRGVGLVGSDESDELIFRHGLERVVELALNAERRDGV